MTAVYLAFRDRRLGREPIGALQLGAEVAALLLIAASFLHFGLSAEALVATFFVTVLVVLSAIDIRERILPNRIVLPATAVVLAAQLLLAPERWAEWLLAPLEAAFFLLAGHFVNPRGMGMGDVKLCLLLGVALGKVVVVALVVGLLAALLPALVVVARRGRAARGVGIPFGPFLAVGGIVALFWGEALLDAYLGTL
jgi:leader peptidase (prepilin peptidase)/N-methyltransferase